MKTTLDIHNMKARIEQAKTRFGKKFRPENARVVCEFLDRLRLENKSHGRIANYAECCQRILQIRDDKNISEWTKKEIESIHKVIADTDYKNSVKKDTLTALKRLCHYAKHDEIADKSKDRDYDPIVSWITPGSFHDKYETIQAKDLLTDEEILNLIQSVKKIGGKYVKRNIAMIFCLFEGSYRPGELLAIKLDGVTFNTDFVRVHTTGKTGPKSLALVASLVPLKEWLAEHPKGDDPDTYLWFHNNENNVIRYGQFYDVIAKARKTAGIKKRVWPYLFRHSALTYYSKRLGNVAKLYGNWSQSSHMLSRYEHLASSDQEDAILKLYGLKKQDDSNCILFSKICPACKESNSSDKSHCTKCGTI
ncbi:MAG: tyrosine-type recombinase/integrase, partial [Nitrosotalea sp.]